VDRTGEYLLIVHYGAAPVVSRTHVISKNLPWYWARPHSCPARSSRRPGRRAPHGGRIFYVDEPQLSGPTPPRGYHAAGPANASTRSVCVSTPSAARAPAALRPQPRVLEPVDPRRSACRGAGGYRPGESPTRRPRRVGGADEHERVAPHAPVLHAGAGHAGVHEPGPFRDAARPRVIGEHQRFETSQAEVAERPARRQAQGARGDSRARAAAATQ